MKKKIVLFAVALAAVFLIQTGPSCSDETKTSTKDIIMQGMKVIQGFQGSQGSQGSQVLPDLVVERIWLDDACQLNVRIKNIGNGAIPDADFAKAVMRISSGKQFKDFPYSEGSSVQAVVDPGGALKAPGGSVEFNTGIKVDRALKVAIFADPRRSIRESNEGNNRKMEQLNPQCSQQTQTTGDAAGKIEPAPSGQGTAPQVDQDKKESGTGVSGQSADTSAPQSSAGGEGQPAGQIDKVAPVTEATTKAGEQQ